MNRNRNLFFWLVFCASLCANSFQVSGPSGATLDSPVPGSYLSMSPEHAGGATIDFRSDLFALGLLLYRLVAGRHPFVASTGEAELPVLQRVMQTAHQPLYGSVAGVSERLSKLVDSLLEKDPRRRPASALAVRQELLAVMREQPVTRGNPLARYMPGTAREEDAVATSVELPASLSRGARSHLLPAREWGPWAFNIKSAWRQAGLVVAIGLVLTGSAYAALAWLDSRTIHVTIEKPQLVLGDDPASVPAPERLSAMLEAIMAAQGRFQPSMEPDAERMLLQVHCNAYVCGMQLSRRGPHGAHTDYRTLVPGASEAA